MKKLLTIAVVLAALVVFASCKNEKPVEEATETEVVTTDSTAVAVDSVATVEETVAE